MMKINIRSFAFIREAIGTKQVQLEVEDGSTIEGVVKTLVAEFDGLTSYLIQDGTIKKDFVFALNGTQIQYDEIGRTKVGDNDTLVILPPAGGG